ncbi:uncharacterized protein LOC130291262 [Hyla sarda]|uniref:uncharacterized protein LOC130273361 n=1 Tax=Hyla sarda TaxID=327740 RepID=UPI0024C2A135|nr:uncharacterized protein LOC130273361 [Hyla sarda]XP_056395817.1 uncharacterized protein LOC130291262 [Hyla sarda]
MARSGTTITGVLPPITPSDQYWSPAESVSRLAKGLRGPGKAKSKKRHILGKVPYTSKSVKDTSETYHETDITQHMGSKPDLPSSGSKKPISSPSAQEEVQPIRATTSTFRAKPDSYRVVSSEESEDSDIHEVDEILYVSAESESDHDDPAMQEDTTVNLPGDAYFDPTLICHPRSGEWLPNQRIAEFLALRANKSLDRPSRSKLKAECPRPSLPNNASATPELDPLLAKFLFKTGKNPKKGVDRSFKSCQDKLMDLLGPLSKILDMADEASNSNTTVDTETLKGWIQRAICIFGNANSALSTERKRSILMKIDPQLTNLATAEPVNPTNGMLFGDDFIRELNKYVGLFSSLNKAQVSMKKVFSSRIFGRAGKGRGRFSGRSSHYRTYRGPYSQPPTQFTAPPTTPSPFFPYRSRPWRSRGQRGYPRSRPPTVQQ